MHPEQIKAAMRMNGITPAMLADELGVTKGSVSQVIHGRGVSARIRARIAKVVGQPVMNIWPSDDRPKLQRRKAA